MTEKIRKDITNALPKEATYLGEFLFLMPDTIWEGKYNGQSFVAVAEDRWSDSSGMFLAVAEDGSVYKGDLADQRLFQYCAASFSQFMEIMSAYHAVLETHQSQMSGMKKDYSSARRKKSFFVKQLPVLIPAHCEMMEHFGVSG